jgi:hypothetical protein
MLAAAASRSFNLTARAHEIRALTSPKHRQDYAASISSLAGSGRQSLGHVSPKRFLSRRILLESSDLSLNRGGVIQELKWEIKPLKSDVAGGERFLNSRRPLLASLISYVRHWVQAIPTFGCFGADTEARLAASFGAEVGQSKSVLRSANCLRCPRPMRAVSPTALHEVRSGRHGP